MLKKTIFAGCLLVGSLYADSVESERVLRYEIIDPFEIAKIQIEEHTYFHLKERWNIGNNAFWHDPECEKCKIIEKHKHHHH